MDKDRIQGSVEQAKGKIKEVAGKVTGDAKLEAEGKTQQTAGKISERCRRLQGRAQGSHQRLTVITFKMWGRLSWRPLSFQTKRAMSASLIGRPGSSAF